MHLIGIEIGGAKLQVVAGNERGEILDRTRFAVDRAAGGRAIRAQIAGALPALIAKWKPAAIGTGYGGPVDWKTGRIKRSHHVEGWEDFPLADWLTEQTGLPAFVENDANTAAFAEAHLGAGRGASTVFWINSGTGVGGGLVIEGKLYHGMPPGEMEVGHLRMDRGQDSGEVSERRILEEECSGPVVDAVTRDIARLHPESPLGRTVQDGSSGSEAKYLAAALAEGCEQAEWIVNDVARWIARGLGHVVHLLNPEVIVFGGGLALIGEPLRDRIATNLREEIMEAMRPGPRILLSALGEDAVPAGALALAAQRLAEREH